MDNDVLIHHGIKGQKWGVRRFQDEDGSLTEKGKKRYSLNRLRFKRRENDSSRKRKNVNELLESHYRKKADEYQKKIDTAKKIKNNDTYVEMLESKRDSYSNDADLKKQGKLTTTEKKVLAGAAIVAAYSTYKFVDSGRATRLKAKGKRLLDKSKSPYFKRNRYLAQSGLSSDEILNRVVNRINPDYGGIGTKNNCRRCTLAYELSRRGYDVKATKSISATGQNAVGLYNTFHDKTIIGENNYIAMVQGYKQYLKSHRPIRNPMDYDYNNLIDMSTTINRKNLFQSHSDAIFDALSKETDRSRGELGILWGVGGGHSVAYEIIDGKPVIFDCQSGKRFTNSFEFSKEFPDISIASSYFTRLDDKELNLDYLLRWVKNV